MVVYFECLWMCVVYVEIPDHMKGHLISGFT